MNKLGLLLIAGAAAVPAASNSANVNAIVPSGAKPTVVAIGHPASAASSTAAWMCARRASGLAKTPAATPIWNGNGPSRVTFPTVKVIGTVHCPASASQFAVASLLTPSETPVRVV